MSNYTNMLDMIFTSHILQKKRDNILKINNTTDKQFSNILNKNIEKLQKTPNEKNTALNQLSPSYTLNTTVNKKDRFEEALNFVLKHEGKNLVHRDGASGESSMYGILQSTANENGYKGNIKDITAEDVKAIYRKIWEKSGASSLPPALSVVHFDTYVNNPAMAKKLLNRSKGDINIYLKMREQQYVNLAEKRPEVFKRYLKGWKTRVDNLRTMIAGIEDKKTTKQT
ncbi:MAG TPA: glycosyl hydrolase 108 family protein [Syntrophorhabdaceae bacterium]|nr:glycosyl hydrolase 108 family protein [Syntrophorhabdaceae bacterium]